MIAPLPPLPVDRVEPTARTCAADAAARPAAGERFADMLDKRRKASDAAGRQASDARERTDAQAAAQQRPPAKALVRGPAADAGEIGPEDEATTAFERAVAVPEPQLGVADAGVVAQHTDATPAPAASASPSAIEIGVPTQSLDPDADTETRSPAQDAFQSGAARGVAGRAASRAAGSGREEPAQQPVATAAHADAAAQIVPAAATAAPESRNQAGPTAANDGSPVGPGAAPTMRPAQAGPAVAAPAINLPSAPGAQAFGHLLGAQVSLFARDGVQQAELRLNPPETGPIGVQIEIVGSDARVNFHAAQAVTREAIERALPELAAALRGEGLTLTGGSVSDRPADAQRDGTAPQARSAGREAGIGVDASGIATVPQRRPVALGRIDLYA